MQKILAATKTAQSVCGEGKFDPRQDYRRSIYCVPVLCEDGTLLYHTMTGALYLLSPMETVENNREELARAHILVPSDFDEYRYMHDVRAILRLMTPPKKKRTHFTIYTTTDCNARCFYCYELGASRVTMTPQIARDVAAYIARVSGGEEVKLSWFGGEPLLNREAIDIICGELQRLNIPYHSIMTSNGYYMDKETAQKMIDFWKVRRIQITIDGTEEVYNRIKAYIQCNENAYARVLENIKNAISRGVNVTIRLNMDANNVDNIFLLVDELHEQLGDAKGLRYRPTLLQELNGPIHRFRSEGEANEKMSELLHKLQTLGMLSSGTLNREMRSNHCMADDDSSETILPDGRVGKCEHDLGKDLIGSIYDDARDEKTIRAWKETVEFEECKSCAIYPLCVQLRKCSWVKSGCSEHTRARLGETLRQRIQNVYQKTVGI